MTEIAVKMWWLKINRLFVCKGGLDVLPNLTKCSFMHYAFESKHDPY